MADAVSDGRTLVVGAFDAALWPAGKPTIEHAWLGIYQVLWWYEHGLLHVREANDLRKSRAWQERAREAERFIASALGLPPGRLREFMDRMMNLPKWQGRQRNNPLGHGLRMLVSEVLIRWASPALDYREEELATQWFPGIQMPGRSVTARVDVLAVRRSTGSPRAVASCKWSIRHDRISDPTNECTQYKAAAIQRQIMDLTYLVVTNELDAQRLDKILNQPCVDAVIHVHLPLAEHLLGGLPPSLARAGAAGRLLDLTELVRRTRAWE